MNRCVRVLVFVVIASCLAATSIGCSNSDLGQVKGTVRMDGEPLPNAMVEFQPLSGKRPGAGVTNGKGEYELIFSRDAKGAVIGDHEVEISTFSEIMGDDTTDVTTETVPARYNRQTELRATVSAGSNVINFDMTSDGEIIQPEF